MSVQGIEINTYYELYTQCKLERDLLKQELKKTKEQLEKAEKSLMKVACFETHGENKYINHEQAYTGVANFARQYFQDKENKE